MSSKEVKFDSKSVVNDDLQLHHYTNNDIFNDSKESI